METRHPVEGDNLFVSFRQSVMLRSNGGMKSEDVEDFGEKFAVFENDPLRGNVKIVFRKDSPPRRASCV